MEKGSTPAENSVRRILVTGPESTGKTDLAEFLAGKYGGIFVPEYARGYIEQLQRPYIYNDVIAIAEKQRLEYHEEAGRAGMWIFFDTWLVITKVWMDVVFHKYPEWISEELESASFDMVLVCAPDIPWEADPVRENGGEERKKLFERYLAELDQLGWRYEIVEGTGEERYRNAMQSLEKLNRNGLF